VSLPFGDSPPAVQISASPNRPCSIPLTKIVMIMNMIACGGYHIVAINCEGKVVCWGENECGQCDVPAELESEVVVAVSCGYSHSVALTADGKVICWGHNSESQCDVPLDIVASRNVTAIACGYSTTYTLTRNGMIMSWGGVPDEQCGPPAELTEVAVVGAGSVSLHAVAITDSGSVVCW
jgi:alpha-tubulin suppressor-like RCC1 family protein